MEKALQWCECDDNDEYFYLEEDDCTDELLLVSVAGRYTFKLSVTDMIITCRDKREPVKKWISLMETESFGEGEVVKVLERATVHYKSISDALDELDEEMDDDDDDDDDGLDIPIIAEKKENTKTPAMIEKERQFEELLKTLKTGTGDKSSVDRILSDYRSIFLSKAKYGWDATPRDGDLFNWEIKLFDFEKGTPLYDDFQKYKQTRGKDYVDMLLSFPPEYPFKPPFLRILRPRFQFHTGRVTIGGSICHELLTTKGWKPVNDIESIITTIRAEITDPEAKARLDLTSEADYLVCYLLFFLFCSLFF